MTRGMTVWRDDGHLTAEAAAVFADGQLGDGPELAGIQAHLAICEDCLRAVGEAAVVGLRTNELLASLRREETVRAMTRPSRRPWRPASRHVFVAIALVALAFVGGRWSVSRGQAVEIALSDGRTVQVAGGARIELSPTSGGQVRANLGRGRARLLGVGQALALRVGDEFTVAAPPPAGGVVRLPDAAMPRPAVPDARLQLALLEPSGMPGLLGTLRLHEEGLWPLSLGDCVHRELAR